MHSQVILRMGMQFAAKNGRPVVLILTEWLHACSWPGSLGRSPEQSLAGPPPIAASLKMPGTQLESQEQQLSTVNKSLLGKHPMKFDIER